MEAAIQQSSVDKQCLEIAKKELLFENDRLLQKIMSQDALLTMMNSIYFEKNDFKAQLQDKDTTICKLKETIKSLRKNNKDKNVNHGRCEIETINKELENSVAKLLFENEQQSDSLIDKLNLKSAENEDLKAQIQHKVFVTTSLKNNLQKLEGKETVVSATQIPSATTIVPGIFKIDLYPLAPRLLQNSEAHIDYLKYTQEQADILWGIVKQAKARQPLDNALDFACNRSQLINFVSKFLGTVRFKNDQIARIMGYGDYQLSNVIISRVYYVEGIRHNLFLVGQLCDADLEVVFRKNTCFIHNLDGVDLLYGSKDTNLYTICLDDMLKTSLICILSKASKTKSWLSHHRLSHLNFDTLNKLAKDGLARDIQCARSDTRPPMLDRTDFAFWQQLIRLYCRGEENGVNILKSIDEGPNQIGTVRETLAESTEGAPQFGESIHDYYIRFAKFINDMRNIKMTMSRIHLNSKFVNNVLPEWGRFVIAVKLNRELRDSNYDQLYAYLKQHKTHAKENKMMLERFSQNTVDPLALMSNVSNLQRYSPSSSTSSSIQVPQPLANNPHLDSSLSPVENLIENLTNTLALLTQSYKTFLPQTNNQLRMSSNARNQATVQDGITDNYDAFNSDVDEAPTTQIMFMANLSSVDPVTDEARPSYDSDILSSVQLNHVVDSHVDYTSDSNMIPYDQYVKDNKVPVVHSNVSSIPNDAFMMIYNDMCESHAQSVSNPSRNTVVKNTLTAELATYKE
uniref:Retrovirus-related Pol polyprotein from transposon TNT 1-94 n=1 Tax=Tanacetum cinerariifolium TaxID=118510 RepID=A0A6L2L3I5_TANCI|nr:retrovirus-related Pol polyprotein from transposon TNT 1-94 [Tanacetum cinerariifolium]